MNLAAPLPTFYIDRKGKKRKERFTPMSTIITEQALATAWQRIDDRLAMMRRRHFEVGDIPFYEAALRPPATEKDLRQLEKVLGSPLPFELAYSFRRWNGCWIAHDHIISLSPISDLIYAAKSYTLPLEEYGEESFDEVIGPINSVLESRKRYNFGGHERSGTFLFLDYEDPPPGGQLGQVIRIGEDPVAEFVAASFVDFLNLVADAPVYNDDPDFDPLEWRG
ncbi:MAG: SMI1/KNR4 family protein [Gammaproteobacteria bacterium]